MPVRPLKTLSLTISKTAQLNTLSLSIFRRQLFSTSRPTERVRRYFTATLYINRIGYLLTYLLIFLYPALW